MTLEDAVALAREAHHGVNDKAGRPYIEHPLRVMARVHSVEEQMAAVLHDTLEDTDVTAEVLRAEGCPEAVVLAVLALTKREGEAYEDFVQRAAANPIARAVKIADVADNSDETRLAKLPPEQATRLREKYAKVKAKLGYVGDPWTLDFAPRCRAHIQAHYPAAKLPALLPLEAFLDGAHWVPGLAVPDGASVIEIHYRVNLAKGWVQQLRTRIHPDGSCDTLAPDDTATGP